MEWYDPVLRVFADLPVLLFVETVLLAFLTYVVGRDIYRKVQKRSGVKAIVIRGEQSMGALYSVYLATVVSLLVLVDKATGVEGHKVPLILLNFVTLTYLFFWSSSFRNEVFFRIKQLVGKD